MTQLTLPPPPADQAARPNRVGVFDRLGSFVVRRRRAVLVVSVLVFLIGAGVGMSAFGKLKTGGFNDPNSSSSRASDLLDRNFGGSADLVLLVRAVSGTVDAPAVAAAGTHAAAQLAQVPGITHVQSYWQSHDPSLRSTDDRYALVIGTQRSGTTIASSTLTALRSAPGGVQITIGGDQAVNDDVTASVGTSLALAEAIAVPLVLLLLLFVFGSAVAALLPLVIGGLAIMGTFAELSILGSLTDVSLYAINLTTALGLALGIDYALLMVSRYREELAAGASTAQAVQTAVRTAGRTIVFSAGTVIAALAALLVFPLYFLRSFAYAGIGVVVIAAVAALLVLPALLSVLGPRINAGRLPWARRPPSTSSRWWGRVAAFTWRRPLVAAVPVLGVMLVAAGPLLHASVGTPDDRVLRTSTASRQVGDVLRSQFAGDATTALNVVTAGPVSTAPIEAYATRLSALPGVTLVQASTGDYAHGARLAGRDPAAAAMVSPGGQRLNVITSADPRSQQAQRLVHAVRDTATPGGATVYVGGFTAQLVDTKHAIGVRLPIALSWIALTTFVVLFLFTGSVVQPLRSLLLNLLTLVTTLGVMVWIFQDGHLSGLLDFTPLPLDTSMLVLLFCITFGLSMDYEVFVLSRIKERHDAGATNQDAVVSGLTRTGRIVTSAALLMAVSFLAFGVCTVSFLQLFGLGAGLAVLIDATLVRGVLVPAAMRLLGNAAWYAPAAVRRATRRFTLAES